MYEVYAYLALGCFVYVGSTKNKKRRFYEHQRGSEFCKDYPNGCFVILESNILKAEIAEREEYWIREYQTYENGYNKTRKYFGMDSEAASLEQYRRVKEGIHHFLGPEQNLRRVKDGTHPFLGGEIVGKESRRRIENGTHHFLDSAFQSEVQRRRIENGTHHFLDSDFQGKISRKRVEDGTHNFLGGKLSRKANYVQKLNRKAFRREFYRIWASVLFTKSLCELYRTRKFEREGFFTKKVVDTSMAEQLDLF